MGRNLTEVFVLAACGKLRDSDLADVTCGGHAFLDVGSQERGSSPIKDAAAIVNGEHALLDQCLQKGNGDRAAREGAVLKE
jgi:hypothetical protein